MGDDTDRLKRTMPEGVPLDKKLFATVPYNFESVSDDVEQITKMINLLSRNNQQAVKQAIHFDKDDFRAVAYSISKRTIGKALSAARPGECFDIVLGGRPPLCA